ncbi:hypothetical protein BUALT_Bualt01G0038500 [Buddleja alternifolia]|uniref:Inhibitor I9 domain-containing protein n=1 Tax=Buddleja alternifolia TaxID=168488 RepID=A0AAV6YC46_9LAMI|nr:hypothetical protein BUALT_Bualt01G0038500 [Buddleja alternifolia]
MDVSAMPQIFSSPHSWYSTTLASATISEISTSKLSSSKLIYSYTKSINGFSALLSPSEHAAIMKSPGFISSVKDMSVELHTTHSYEFLGLNSYYGAWPKSDYGRDVIIGVVDTGVWPESESFNDEGMTEVPSKWKGECQAGTQFNSSTCNKKLIGARYFNNFIG